MTTEAEPKEEIFDKTPEKKEKSRHLIIGLHGAIGAGKTELARLLERELGLVHFEEEYEDNPYLVDFYRNPKGFSYLMECCFLESKARQMTRIPELAKDKVVVIDPTIWQDAEIYAFVHHKLGWMTDGQYEDYLMHYRGLCRYFDLLKPDIVISVQASVETIEARIRQRDRPYEMAMLKKTPEYFAEIARRTEEWVEENRRRVPILEVDSGNLNYVVNTATQGLIIKDIRLKAIQVISDHPELDLPESLRYYWPNYDSSINRRNHLRH